MKKTPKKGAIVSKDALTFKSAPKKTTKASKLLTGKGPFKKMGKDC